jgi:hypothetical protein
MRIEVLWFDGCPNYERARAALDGVLTSRGVDASTIHSIVVDAVCAAALKFPGSPTIRVNGCDIEPGFRDPSSYPLSCSVYQTDRGLQGVPETDWIERAIDHALCQRD